MTTIEQSLSASFPFAKREMTDHEYKLLVRQAIKENDREELIRKLEAISSSIAKILFESFEKMIQNEVKNTVKRESKSPNPCFENKTSL